MRKTPRTDPDMEPEYDFSKGVRGKFAKQVPRGVIAVVLDPDIAQIFPDSDSVNDALRSLGKIIRSRLKDAGPSEKKTRKQGRKK
jgi:hypothetical protein